jgi:cysteinyl-tRNA synthetase
LPWGEHGRASVDRQAELAINRYAIALDWCHRTADRKRREMSPLELYNTRTRAKQTFIPADPSGGSDCSSGPTVNDLPHLRHAKTYPQFDFLVRLPRPRGFALRYVQNVTDVDDKIIRRARELGDRGNGRASEGGHALAPSGVVCFRWAEGHCSTARHSRSRRSPPVFRRLRRDVRGAGELIARLRRSERRVAFAITPAAERIAVGSART